MASLDPELENQLLKVGNQLLSPPHSLQGLLALLDQVDYCLSKVEQSPSESMRTALSVSQKALISDPFLTHSDIDVKVAVASCLSEITRISAPEAPYDDEKMKVVFHLIVSSFENISDHLSRSFMKRVTILETVAKVRLCLVMLDLDCDDLILEMFRCFLKNIRNYHPENVFSSMEKIMTLVLEESEDVLVELLAPVLAFAKKNEEVLPTARELGEKVIDNCFTKLKPYISQDVINSNGKRFFLCGTSKEVGSDIVEWTENDGVISSLIRNNEFDTSAFRLTNGYTALKDALEGTFQVSLDGIQLTTGVGCNRESKFYSVYSLEGLDTGSMDNPGVKISITTFVNFSIGYVFMPPKWSLGYQKCRWSYDSTEQVLEMATTFCEKGIPCEVIWMDIDYMDRFRCFTFDKERFSNPQSLVMNLHQSDFKALWMFDPGIKKEKRYFIHGSGCVNDVWVQKKDGKPFAGEFWPDPCVLSDFTQAKVRSWWANLAKGFTLHGVDGIWNDMNESAIFKSVAKTKPESNIHNGDEKLGGYQNHYFYHNVYGRLMARSTYEDMTIADGSKRPFVLTGSGFVGGQRYAATGVGEANLMTYYVTDFNSLVATVQVSKTDETWKRPKLRLHVQLLLGSYTLIDAWGIDGDMAALATLMHGPVPIQNCLISDGANRHSRSSAHYTIEDLRPALQQFLTLWSTLVVSPFEVLRNEPTNEKCDVYVFDRGKQKMQFPFLNLEDKVVFRAGGNDTITPRWKKGIG